MKQYTLYLDESKVADKNKLVVAGFAIASDDESLLKTRIYDIKKILWEQSYIDANSTVLHCTELSTIKNNKSNPKLVRMIKRDCYKFFCSLEPAAIKCKVDEVMSGIANLISTLPVTVFGCVIDLDKYKEYYSFDNERDNEYFIALEMIIENYAHFLERQNAVGSIVYESQNTDNGLQSMDVRMYQNYSGILSNNKGIVSVCSEEIHKRIRCFSTVSKMQEIPGLELADFMVFYLTQNNSTAEMDKPLILKATEKRIHNGGFNLAEKDIRCLFGLRHFPFEYDLLSSQKNELKTVKRALKNAKQTIHKLEQKNERIIAEKRKIEQELKKMKECNGNTIVPNGSISE